MEDKDIVKLYLARDEAAIAETQKKYGRYCHYIAVRITGDDRDAEEIVSDTYLKAWNTIPPHTPDPLKPYLGMLTRQLAVNRLEENTAKKRSGEAVFALEELSECLPDAAEGNMAESVALRDGLERFLKSLPDQPRRVFLQRYWYACPVAEIAADCGLTVSHVTVLLLRTRKKLKAHLEKEGFDL
ncbi:MAG: RNA polymerase sigma factor [Clostridia bacterium]|nr:RNA polymerase sigma factor [Clostridia bacterium]